MEHKEKLQQAARWKKELSLNPHPEGGWYAVTYESAEHIPHQALPARFTGPRAFSTAIYYLLEEGDFSAWHRVKADETWHWYDGGSLLLSLISPDGEGAIVELGPVAGQFQFTVPAGTWMAAEASGLYVLVGCTVAPGFHFDDFEMGDGKALARQWPDYASWIARLSRG
jgi:uncharacterized protein